LNELADHASKLVTFTENDRSTDAVLSEAEARNRNSQPANLTGFDQNLVKATRDWVSNRRSHMRGSKKS
jgi:type IV pilus biogenesis protein CpaD/CtpE